MKKVLIHFTAIIALASNIYAQDLGKLIIRNGNNNYPKFIASLNGIRLSNEYNSTATFAMLDDNIYKLKLLQSGSTNLLTYTLSSEPKYLSKFVITKDNVGNYAVILESKSLMLEDHDTPVVTNTVVTTPTIAVITNTIAVNTPTSITTTTVTSTIITNISKAEFDERLAAIKRTSFDDKRLAKAKQVFNDEILSTNQVIEVVKVFSFDDSKLDFAKWAYKNTIDPKNYYKVEDHFSFSNSKYALGEFVKKQPK